MNINIISKKTTCELAEVPYGEAFVFTPRIGEEKICIRLPKFDGDEDCPIYQYDTLSIVYNVVDETLWYMSNDNLVEPLSGKLVIER